MPNERVSMSKLKQLIALQAMARGLGLPVGAVSKYLRAVRAAGIGPDEAETLPENEFEQRVFGPAPPCKPPKLVPPDYPWVHTELKRQRHVKLLLPAVQSLYFEERIAMLIDRERLYRDNQSRTRPLRGARLKVAQASIVDINYKAPAGSTSVRAPSSPAASGHAAPRTCSSPARPARARRGSPARSRSRRAARRTRCSTGRCRA